MAARPDGYRQVQVERPQRTNSGSEKNLIRVVNRQPQRKYIGYAVSLLTGSATGEKFDSVKITAMGNAIHKAKNIATNVRRYVSVHTTTDVSKESITDVFESIDDKDANQREIQREVDVVSITLSTVPLDAQHPTYLEPPTTVEQYDPKANAIPAAGEDSTGRPRKAKALHADVLETLADLCEHLKDNRQEKLQSSKYRSAVEVAIKELRKSRAPAPTKEQTGTRQQQAGEGSAKGQGLDVGQELELRRENKQKRRSDRDEKRRHVTVTRDERRISKEGKQKTFAREGSS